MLLFERCGWLWREDSLDVVGKVIYMMKRFRCCLGVMELRCGVGVRMRLWSCLLEVSKHSS